MPAKVRPVKLAIPEAFVDAVFVPVNVGEPEIETVTTTPATGLLEASLTRTAGVPIDPPLVTKTDGSTLIAIWLAALALNVMAFDVVESEPAVKVKV